MVGRARVLQCLGPLLVCVAAASACHDGPEAPTCTYAVSALPRTFGYQGGTADVTVGTGPSCAWTARSDAAWAVLSSTAGTGPGTVRVTVAANADFTSRIATLQVAGASVSLTEDGLAPCFYVLAPSTQQVGPSGGLGTLDVDVQDYCVWTASVSDSWVTLGTGQNSQGRGVIQYAVAANTSRDERVATMTVGNRTATVRQAAAAACSCVLAPTGQAFGPAGGNGTIAVQAPAGCTWAVSSDQPWIRVTSTSIVGVTGNATVRFDVEANTAPSSREGRLAIGDQLFRVTQAGMSECSYAVSPVEFVLHWHHESGQIQISTQAGCPWTASTQDSWLTLSGASAGSGPAVLNFNLPVLATESTRRGPVKVRWPTPTAGQNVWVTQEGCRYGIGPSTLNVSADGGRSRIDVLTQPLTSACSIGCSWTATSRVPWVRVVGGSPGAGDNPFTIEVDRNTTGVDRAGTVTVADRTLAVYQAR